MTILTDDESLAKVYGFTVLANALKYGTKTARVMDQARDYLNAVEQSDKAHECEHGHPDCAAWGGGLCSDEVSALFD